MSFTDLQARDQCIEARRILIRTTRALNDPDNSSAFEALRDARDRAIRVLREHGQPTPPLTRRPNNRYPRHENE